MSRTSVGPSRALVSPLSAAHPVGHMRSRFRSDLVVSPRWYSGVPTALDPGLLGVKVWINQACAAARGYLAALKV